MFSYKEDSISLMFSGSDTSHCTTMPLGVSDMPEILKGQKTMKSIMAHKTEVMLILRKVVSWCVFGAKKYSFTKSKEECF